jgi:GNAT superfamily N-acetyltransferase
VSDLRVSVRHAGAGDGRLLRAIRLESLADTPDAYGTTYEESVTWSRARWRTVAAKWNYYLAECDGAVVGMASGGYNDSHPGTHWLFGMYVTPSARGTGVAAQLVDAISEWARGDGARSLYLHVTESVARARAFYEKMGFQLNGESIKMGRDPSLTLVTMVRALD